MGDKIYMLLLLIGVVAGAGAAIYYFVLPKGNDVRNIDTANQERRKPAHANAMPTAAKTAQLSALRERLADAQTSTTGLKKIPSKAIDARSSEIEKPWRPEEAGLGEARPVVEADMMQKPTTIKPVVVRPVEALSMLKDTAVVAPNTTAGNPPAAHVSVASVTTLPLPAVFPGSIPVTESAHMVDAVLPPLAVKPAVVGKVHILLVDDSKVVRVKTEKLLLNKGYIVTTAVDGIDALAKLETLKPAIIITDIEMPNLDGFGLVRNVRGNLRTSEIPVIVMTSHVNLHLDIAATEGINGFLPKPFNDQDLLDQVAFLCES